MSEFYNSYGEAPQPPYTPEVVTETVEEVVAEPVKEAPKKRRRRSAPSLTPAQVRRVSDKAVEVLEAEPRVRSVCAELLSVDDDASEIVVAMFGSVGKFSPLETIVKIREHESDMMGALEVSTLTRTQVNAVWQAARILGADIPETVPGNDMRAFATLTQGVREISDDHLVASVSDLLEAS